MGPDNSTCLAAPRSPTAFSAAASRRRCELAERAIEVHPNSTFVRNRAGAVYSVSGESDKAIAQFEAAQRMNPLDNKTATVTFTVATTAHFFARRFEESVRWGRRAMAITPDANIARWITDRGSRASRSPRRGASRDRQDSRAASQSYARTRAPASFRHDWMYELYLDGLRKAGLREE